LKTFFHAFWVALQFLTLLPVPSIKGAEWSDQRPLQAVYFYPVIGGLLGSVIYLAAFALPIDYPWVSGVILTLVWVWLTGGLHLDGVADAADGWMGGLGSREKTLAIMKDPHVGVTGMLALLSVLLLKVALVPVLLMEAHSVWLVLIPVFARGCAVFLLATTPYVSDKGIATGWANRVGARHVLVSAIICLLFAQLQSGSLWVLFWMIAGTFVLRSLMQKRLKGCTGDTIGATVELTEVIALFSVYACIG
jgi:adenosylcobinamide-GDP ribazoletransferase